MAGTEVPAVVKSPAPCSAMIMITFISGRVFRTGYQITSEHANTLTMVGRARKGKPGSGRRALAATARRMSGGPSCCDAVQLLSGDSSACVRAHEGGTGHLRWGVDLRVTRVGHLPPVGLVPRVPVHLL